MNLHAGSILARFSDGYHGNTVRMLRGEAVDVQCAGVRPRVQQRPGRATRRASLSGPRCSCRSTAPRQAPPNGHAQVAGHDLQHGSLQRNKMQTDLRFLLLMALVVICSYASSQQRQRQLPDLMTSASIFCTTVALVVLTFYQRQTSIET